MFDHMTTMRPNQFKYLLARDKQSSEATVTSDGEFTIYKVNHASFGRCVGIFCLKDDPLVFSERKIPADYPNRQSLSKKSDAAQAAA